MDPHRTLYLATSANPLGFHHLALAEWALESLPELDAAVFLISNGLHPDPHKPNAQLTLTQRLTLAQDTLSTAFDPQTSFLARRAAKAGRILKLNPSHARAVCISNFEGAFQRPVRSAEMLIALPSPVHWCIGSDLLERMLDPSIFSAADLAVLAQQCRLVIVPRPQHGTQHAQKRTDKSAAHDDSNWDNTNQVDSNQDDTKQGVDQLLARVRAERGVALKAIICDTDQAPRWLKRLLMLSSTKIRHAAACGDPLTAMLPAPSAEMIHRHGYFAEAPQLEREKHAQEQALARSARRAAKLLRERQLRGRPHRLAVVECSTAGLIASALVSLPGASRFFAQGRLTYDAQAKKTLLAPTTSTPPVAAPAAVSAAMVQALAEGLATASGAELILAESGMAGPPDGLRRSSKSGHSHLALLDVSRGRTLTRAVEAHPYATRGEHQRFFAQEALRWLCQFLDANP